MTDILADYREWRAEQENRIGTHGDRCHMWPRHERCMIHRLAKALEAAMLTAEERQAIARDQEHLCRHPQATVRLPREPEDFEISEANGYAAAIEDFKRALTEAGIEWVQ
jgi:hypothetical protein